MPREIPARLVSQVRKDRVQTGLRLDVPELIIDAAILQLDGPHHPHVDAAQCLAIAGQAEFRGGIIAGVQEQQRQHHESYGAQNRPHTTILRGGCRPRLRGTIRRQQVGKYAGMRTRRQQREACPAGENPLRFEHREESLRHRRLARDLLQCLTDSRRADGRRLANSMAASRSAELVMTLTWLAPACLIADVTCRKRFTTFSSICLIIPTSRK